MSPAQRASRLRSLVQQVQRAEVALQAVRTTCVRRRAGGDISITRRRAVSLHFGHGPTTGQRVALQLDADDLRAARLQPADRHRRHRHGDRRVPYRVAVADCRDPELREAQRRPRHLARVAFPLADPYVLVRPALGGALRRLHRDDARHRDPDRVGAADHRRGLVHLPGRARLAGAARPPSDVRVMRRAPHATPQAGVILIIARAGLPGMKFAITLRKYFRSSSLSALRRSSPSMIDAVASSHGPFTVPRTLHAATRTRGLLRMRLTFHESATVYT